MKRSVLLIALFGIFMSAQAQESRPHCFTSEITNPLIDSDPQYRQNREYLESFTEQYVKNNSVQRRAGGSQVYIIPVVFHILHNYGPENVSDQQIRDAVERLNIDFRKLNSDTVNIIPEFKSIAADAEMEFRLATLDPVGNCTNGIEHLQTLETYQANDSSKRDPNWMIWPNNKYLNIWVANTLQNTNAAAYAHLPGGANNTDGIMCWYTYVDNLSNTLTHEVGHHFNLLHTWGQGNTPGVSCTGSDGVADTPPTKGYNFCPSSPGAAAICFPPTIENYQNYMDYSYCDMMFTEGQKLRMHACLNASASGRNNLWTNANLIATGTDQLVTPTCSPIADFKAEAYASCVGSPIRFFNQSWKGEPTTYTWSFPGGVPATSNDTNPQVVYSTPGEYNATLIVANAAGSDTITKNRLIHISGQPLTPLPYSEDFEDSLSFPGIDGWVQNNGGGSIQWDRVNYASADGIGSHSIKINNYTNTVRNEEDWITPSMNFTGITFPIRLTFKVAHAQRSASAEDELSIQYTSDCGLNWQPSSYVKSGSSLATNGGNYITSSFTPNSSQWRLETVTINAVQNLPKVRFKFHNRTARGNNIYIDDINITGTGATGIDEEANFASALSVYPNPSQGSSFVDFNLINGSMISLEVKDVIGQTVAKVIQTQKFGSGLHHIELPVLSSGIYMINVTVNNKLHVVKLVVS